MMWPSLGLSFLSFLVYKGLQLPSSSGVLSLGLCWDPVLSNHGPWRLSPQFSCILPAAVCTCKGFLIYTILHVRFKCTILPCPWKYVLPHRSESGRNQGDFSENQAAEWVRNQINVVWSFHYLVWFSTELWSFVSRGFGLGSVGNVWFLPCRCFCSELHSYLVNHNKPPSQPFATYTLHSHSALQQPCDGDTQGPGLPPFGVDEAGSERWSDLSVIFCVFQRSGFCFLCPRSPPGRGTYQPCGMLAPTWMEFLGLSLRIPSTW